MIDLKCLAYLHIYWLYYEHLATFYLHSLLGSGIIEFRFSIPFQLKKEKKKVSSHIELIYDKYKKAKKLYKNLFLKL